MRPALLLVAVPTLWLCFCARRGDYDYPIMINYELGMHCTGFDFEYCCILPPYNSIQAQVVKVGLATKARVFWTRPTRTIRLC